MPVRGNKGARHILEEWDIEPVVVDTPAMHRIFYTVELVQLICGHCTSLSLAALARTSRLFQPPALKQLYRILKVQAFRSLITNFADSSPTHTPSLMAAQRFSSYSKLVHQLDLTVGMHSVADTLAQKVPLIVARTTSLPLFPSLRQISADVGSSTPLVLILFLLMGDLPGLEAFTLGCYLPMTESLSELAILMDILPARCANLKRLEVHNTSGDNQDVSQVWSTTINKLEHLEHLSLANLKINPDVLQSLSKHCSLKSLALRNEKPSAGSISLDDFPTNGLHRLRNLQLAVRVSDIAPLLQAVPDTISELLIDASIDTGTSIDTRALAQVVPRFVRLTRMELEFTSSLSLRERLQRRRAITNATIATVPMASLFQLILACHQLQLLRIYGDLDLDPPEDKDFKRISTSCPELRSLLLRWRPANQAPTLQSLLALNEGCPDLSVIQISRLIVKDKWFVPPAASGVIRSQALDLSIADLTAKRPDVLSALLAGRWPAVKIRAGEQTEAVLQGLRAIRRYQAAQALTPDGFDPDVDST